MLLILPLAQVPQTGPSAAAIFYITLLVVFLTAVITTVATRWSRDKCLKFFNRYVVTLQRARGQTLWGTCRVFSSGIEVVYIHPFVDPHGRRKNSYLIYGHELDQHLLSLFRYHDALTEPEKAARLRQVRKTFRPGFFKRLWRGIRNFVNTLRDAFNAVIGTAVTQYQRVNPAASTVLAAQGGQVTAVGQTLLGRFANAYEPLLEQYIGYPVILDVADPINPNNQIIEYAGYLADYTQHFIAIFNVEHPSGDMLELVLPDEETAPPLPPLPGPPPPGAPPPVLPPPVHVEHDLAVRLDGLRIKVQNTRPDPVVLRRLEREGFEPISFGLVLAPSATLDLPARDARGAKLIFQGVRKVDVVAPRRLATVRHAGELTERKTLLHQFEQLPLIPKILSAVREPLRK